MYPFSLLLLALWGTCILAYPATYTIPNVPYYRQMDVYDCGCASLQMVFNYWNPDVDANQYYLSNIARTSEEVGTAATDMVRAGRFSVLSSAAGYPFPNFTLQNGIPDKPLGYASFGFDKTPWLNEVKASIASNIPIIILMLYASTETDGHYRVAVGYDDVNQTITLHDPWGRDDQPKNITFTYTEFMDLWNYTQNPKKFSSPKGPYFGIMMSPFAINTKVYESSSGELSVVASVVYPIQSPFDQDPVNLATTASNVIISLQLEQPTNFTITNTQLAANVGNLQPGDSAQASWNVACGSSCSGFVATIQVRGIIADAVPYAVLDKTYNYPPYQYVDVIGGEQTVSYL